MKMCDALCAGCEDWNDPDRLREEATTRCDQIYGQRGEAGTAVELVVTKPTAQDVVTVPAAEQIVTLGAVDRVVTGATDDRGELPRSNSP